jgi:hypothetical protein
MVPQGVKKKTCGAGEESVLSVERRALKRRTIAISCLIWELQAFNNFFCETVRETCISRI